MANDKVHDVESVTLALLEYCRSRDWSGYDPYDGLNSRLFNAVPLRNSKIARLIVIQAFKRSPLNLRGLLGVPHTKNPKAIGLFIMSAIKLERLELLPNEQIIESLLADLMALRSPDTNYWCWGYSFPWQTRGKLVPRGAANLVSTVFAANSLLDAFEFTGNDSYLNAATNAGEYIVDQLYYSDGEIASFRYPLPTTPAKVHNANFLAAALLARIFSLTNKDGFVEPAMRVARYSAARQLEDGSWYYGEAAKQRWIDNFHTGYNLSALHTIQRCLNTTEFDRHLAKGFEFYRKHFIREDGAARYFHNQTYPIDIHCVAQTILTLLEFAEHSLDAADLVQRVYEWAMTNMWDERGFFYYRVLRTVKIRTSYMRWSQAWMLLALTTLLEHSRVARRRSERMVAVA